MKFEFLKISVGTLILRYYLMMLIVLIAGFMGQWWLTIFAFPIFASAILGIKLKR